MSPNSSTSSSESRPTRRYLVALAVVTCLVLFAAAALSVFGIRHRLMTWHYTQLLRYQFDKLAKSKDAKILLVGDSALGNAVDARAWSSALGEPVLSLALTGAYGYGGSLNMIRNAARTQPIHTIILFHHVRMMMEPVSSEGMVLTAERWTDLDLVPFSAIWSSVINLSVAVNVTGTLLFRSQDRTATFAPVDYVPQAAALPETSNESAATTLDPAAIVPGHTRFLSAIAAFCTERGIRCLYVHGPLTSSICRNSTAFVAAANRNISAAGLTAVSGPPICLPWQETGDTDNHVRPPFKAEYSARYLALIKPYLGNERARTPR